MPVQGQIMSQLSLKKKVLEFIINNPGVMRGEVQRYFSPTPIGEELDELLKNDKAYSLGSNDGCFPAMDTKGILEKLS